MNIVILGATGRIGKALVSGLRNALPDAVVTGCTRDSVKAENEGLVVFHPAYDDWSQLGHVDVLVNAIGAIRETEEGDFDRAHGGISSLIVCNRDEISHPKVIQISALGADESAQDRFLQTKGVADRILLSAGNAAVVRPSVVCTDNTLFLHGLLLARTWADAMLGVLPVPKGILDTRLQPVCLVDLVDVVVRLCLTDDHKPVIDLTGADVYTVRDFFTLLSAGGRPLHIVELPRSLVEAALSLFRFVAPSLPIELRHLRLLQHDNIAPNDEARRLLGRNLHSTLPFWKYTIGGRVAKERRNARETVEAG